MTHDPESILDALRSKRKQEEDQGEDMKVEEREENERRGSGEVRSRWASLSLSLPKQ
jgi:hypothetical protein